MSKRYKVYIAGPEVFSNEAKGFFEAVRSACEQRNLEALVPYAPELGLTDPEAIFRRNVDLMVQANGAIASLKPYNGTVEPDSGTVWECGFMWGHAKPVVGWMADFAELRNQQAERVRSYWMRQKHYIDPGATLMPDGNHLESFGYPHNLMLQYSCGVEANAFEQALDRLREHLEAMESAPPDGSSTVSPIPGS